MGIGKTDTQPPGLLRTIGVFKLVKGVALILLASGALVCLRGDLGIVLTDFAEKLQVDPHNRHFVKLFNRVAHIKGHTVVLLSAGTFFYAGLFLTEGLGLLSRKRWAEYLTICATGSFIPLEIYEAVRHNSLLKMAVIAVNAAIVVYLVLRLRHEHQRRKRKSQ